MTRITTKGRAWYDPKGGVTAWQREQAYGPIASDKPSGAILWMLLPVVLTVLVFGAIAVWGGR